MSPVVSDTGVTIAPTATFQTCPARLDVLFVPGGTNATLAAIEDEDTLGFVTDRGGSAAYMTSVCTGSVRLGAAGLLRGYGTRWRAPTPPAWRDTPGRRGV
jgi:cyclohexyl-isocyanide hydratase